MVQKSAEASSIGHMPSGPWAFDAAVAAVFDDMLQRSVPEYDAMRDAVFQLGCRFVQEGTHIVDLGCSRGGALAPFVEKYGDQNRYVGVELSMPMLNAARQRFQCEIEKGLVALLEMDLREAYPQVSASVTLCVLTLQFVPIDHRQAILRAAFESTVDGGAFVLVEKVLASTSDLSHHMIELYHDRKRNAGYSEEEVSRKRLSLEGVLVPLTARWNEDLLKSAGFREIDSFWRWMNFSGWIAVK